MIRILRNFDENQVIGFFDPYNGTATFAQPITLTELLAIFPQSGCLIDNTDRLNPEEVHPDLVIIKSARINCFSLNATSAQPL